MTILEWDCDGKVVGNSVTMGVSYVLQGRIGKELVFLAIKEGHDTAGQTDDFRCVGRADQRG